MKKLLLLFLFTVSIASFVSCTDNTDEHEKLYESQATDKDDASNPNNGGGTTVDPTED